jgi:hypothetical protein
MKKYPCMFFGLLAIFLLISIEVQTPATRAAGEDNPLLATANNQLRELLPDSAPALQPGHANPDDVWLLYSPAFDYLSAANRSYLMRKYGLAAALDGNIAPSPTLLDRETRGVPRGENEIAAPSAYIASDNSHVNDPNLDIRQRVQSETSSAIFGQNAVVAYNDVTNGVFSTISYSNNGGLSWRSVAPPIYPSGGGQGDPSLTVGPGGVFYYAHLASTAQGLSTLGVTRSTDGGATWSPLVNATAGTTNRLVSHDKEWLMADTSNSRHRGNLYLSWTRFTNIFTEDTGIAFARSTDGGRSWSKYQLIGNPADAAGFVQASTIAVGPDGEVYVSYFDTRIPGIAVVKSTDGGVTFGPPVTALRDPGGRFGRNLAGGFELFPGASLDADRGTGPTRGVVYLSTTIKPENPRDEADVVVAASTDGGATWNAPVKVSDEETDTDQFMSSLAVMPGGLLGVMWYDRRNDPRNNVLVDVYMSTSTDGGRTFSPNRRLTANNWPFVPTPFGFRTAYHGDYNQMSASEAGFLVCWADDRSGTDPDVYANLVGPYDAAKPRTDFITSTQTPSKNVFAGANTQFTIDIEALSSAYAITPRDLSGFPRRAIMSAVPGYPGLTYQFSLHSDRGILTVNVAPGTPPGTYPIAATVSVRGLLRATTVRLNVYDPARMAETPQPLSGLRDTVFQPRAAVGPQGDLHLVSAGDARRLFASFGSLSYARFRNGLQIGSALITRLSNPNSTILNPSIGVDNAGAITIVWRQFDAATNRSDIYFARTTNDGASFGTPVNLTRNNGRFLFVTPALAVARDGAINLVYAQINGTTNAQEVVFTRSTDGGVTFTPPVPISGTLTVGTNTAAPAIALEPSGAAVVAFIAAAPTTRADVFVTRAAAPGGAFSTPVNASVTFTPLTSVLNVLTPALAVDVAGAYHVAFIRSDLDLAEQEAYVTRSADRGATFSEPINASRVSIGGAIGAAPSIAAGPGNTIGLAWSGITLGQFPAGRDAFYATSADGGRNFTPAVNLSSDIGLQFLFPQVFVNGSGRLSVLWEDETGGNNQAMIVTP